MHLAVVSCWQAGKFQGIGVGVVMGYVAMVLEGDGCAGRSHSTSPLLSSGSISCWPVPVKETLDSWGRGQIQE